MEVPQAVSEFLRHQEFVAFDTETTGLSAPFNRLVELAGVRFRPGDEQIDTFHSLINPQRSIPSDVIGVHGITDDMVADAPPAKPVLERFMDFCGNDSILIAHHAPFDISFISCELDRAGLAFPENPVLDTVDIYRRLYRGLESYSLLSLVNRFDIARSQEHRALADAHLVRYLFLRAVPRYGHIAGLKELTSTFAAFTISGWPGLIGELPPEFGEMDRALENNLRVEITYRSPTKPPADRVILPRQVYLVGSALYISAYCEQAGAERTFRLDRIERFTVLD